MLTDEGRDVEKIAKILQDLDDWDEFAGRLNIEQGTITNIGKNCRVSNNLAKCQWRELVKTYCDMNDRDFHKTVANMTDILHEINKKRQAQKLRQLEPTSELVTQLYTSLQK